MQRKNFIFFIGSILLSTNILFGNSGLSFPAILITSIAYDSLDIPQLSEQAQQTLENAPFLPKSFISPHLFDQQITLFNVMQKNILSPTNKWLGDSCCLSRNGSYAPFIQKKIVKPETKLILVGDLHGNFHGLLRLLHELINRNQLNNNFKLSSDVCLIFLGNYVDKGVYGLEVLYTLFKLKNSNPDQVFLLRGNHEDLTINKHYGFADELMSKLAQKTDATLSLLNQAYQLMPSALFIGCQDKNANESIDFIQCCHGGLEIGITPKNLLASSDKELQSISHLDRIAGIRGLPKNLKTAILAKIPAAEIVSITPSSPTDAVTNGFLWNDFMEDEKFYDNQFIDHTSGRGWVCGQRITEHLLSRAMSPQARVRAVFRAHQYYGPLARLLKKNNGCVPHWGGLVYTIFSVPIARTSFNKNSMLQLTTAPNYENWQKEHIVVSP